MPALCRRSLASSHALLPLAAAACGGAPTTPATPPVDAVVVTPSTLTVLLDEERTLTATPQTKEQPVTGRVVTWSSSDPTVVSLTSGTVRGVRAGSASISAASEGKTGKRRRDVGEPRATVPSMSPASAVAARPPRWSRLPAPGSRQTPVFDGTAHRAARRGSLAPRSRLLSPAADLQAEGQASACLRAPGAAPASRDRSGHSRGRGERPPAALLEEAGPVVADEGVRARLVSAYGTRWREVWGLAAADPWAAERLVPELPVIGAELVHGVTREMAVTLGDLLIRRTGLAFSLPDQGRAVAGEAACRVAPLLGWDSVASAAALGVFADEVNRVFGVQ